MDASGVIVTALEQHVRGKWHLLGFLKQALPSGEQQYSIFDWECSLCCHGLSLEGHWYSLLTNYHHLIHAVHCVTDAWSSQQQHHLSVFADFHCHLQMVSFICLLSLADFLVGQKPHL